MCVSMCVKGEGMKASGGEEGGEVGWIFTVKDLAKEVKRDPKQKNDMVRVPSVPNVLPNIFIQESLPVCICTKLPGDTA